MTLKYAITKGYIRLTAVDGKGNVISEGGFVEDWNKGLLWVFIDLTKNEVVEGSFQLSRLLEQAKKYVREVKRK